LTVIEKVCTLEELENHWSLDDSMRAIAVLDMKEFIQREHQKEIEKINNK